MDVPPPPRQQQPDNAAAPLPRAQLPPYDMLQPRAPADLHLPGLQTVLSPKFQCPPSPPAAARFASPGSPPSTASLPRIEPRARAHGSAHGSVAAASASPPDAGSPMDAGRRGSRTRSGVSLADDDVRDVAEALVGLGHLVRSPPPGSAHVSPHTSPHSRAPPPSADDAEHEPLLELLTQAYPRVRGTINGSMSVYSGAKSITPRFVQAGITLAERNIGSPVVNAVGSVGRMTGVEQAARRYLKLREQEEDGADAFDEEALWSRRRPPIEGDMDVDSGIASPRSCGSRDSASSRAESLPPYRANKQPPPYREEASPATAARSPLYDRPPPNHRTWSQHLILSASGLGVAMSDRSRRSLVFCLQLLSRSAEHIATVSDALKLVLEQYDQARDHWHQHNSRIHENGDRPRTPDHDDSARRLASVIRKHCDDIWHTLKTVVHSVSNTAGGALPGNAREFVRTQLLSLPQRWRMVSDDESIESDTSRHAHRMIAFATEGLDMIQQVSQMCRATLDSAEGWANMVGRRQRAAAGEKPRGSSSDHDVEMGNTDDPAPAPRTEKQ